MVNNGFRVREFVKNNLFCFYLKTFLKVCNFQKGSHIDCLNRVIPYCVYLCWTLFFITLLED